jgi:hypothetical protein
MVRAKFRVMEVTKHHTGQLDVRCRPVYNDPDRQNAKENAEFWEYTPSGELTLSLAADAPAARHFLEGGSLAPDTAFYLDFTPAPGD